MDYPEKHQYELIELSDQTWVIPQSAYAKLRARYGDKVFLIPQSIHLPREVKSLEEPEVFRKIPHPRLGYLGPIYARLNVGLLRAVLSDRPNWHFVCTDDTSALGLKNAHGVPWIRSHEITRYLKVLDLGLMPYDCFSEKNLHCVPLKLFDYFSIGLPVVSTPVLGLREYSNLIYFGDTARTLITAIELGLSERLDSTARVERKQVAESHSTDALGRRLEELLQTEKDTRGI
jgi:hypothetical protein